MKTRVEENVQNGPAESEAYKNSPDRVSAPWRKTEGNGDGPRDRINGGIGLINRQRTALSILQQRRKNEVILGEAEKPSLR